MKMRRTSPRLHRGAGFTLIEMLIAMVVMGVVMGAVIRLFRGQSLAFRKGGASMDLHQNARFTTSTLDRVIRTTGSGVVSDQPMLIYGGANVIAFNANYASDIQDGNAVYINPNLPATAIDALPLASALTIPNTAVTYPQRNYSLGAGTPSRAETIVFYTAPDPSTANPNDVMLMERVNNTPAEMVARNLLPYPSRPFFEYWWSQCNVATGDTVQVQVTAAQLPIYHNQAVHNSPADLPPANCAGPHADLIRSLRVNYTAWNGLTGVRDSTSRLFATSIRIPNNGLGQPQTCGDAPTPPLAVGVANVPAGTQTIQLTWNPSGDEASGEKDVLSYNIYVRPAGNPTWQTYRSQPAGLAAYDVTISDPVAFPPTSTWEFGVASQDCSPQESSVVTAAPNPFTAP